MMTSLAELRSKQSMLNQLAVIRSKRMEKEKATMRTKFGIRDKPNSLLELPVDLHK